MDPQRLVATNLASLRTQRGMTQRAFLAKLHEHFRISLEQATYSRKEAGIRAVSIGELYLFAAVLEVSPLEVLLPREATGYLDLSDTVTVSYPVVRAWLRGHRQLASSEPAEDVELEDQVLVRRGQQVRGRQQRLFEQLVKASRAIEDARDDVERFENELRLFDDARTDEVRTGARRRLEQALLDHARLLRELEDSYAESQALRQDAVTQGWFDEADAQQLLADATRSGHDPGSEYRTT